MKRCFLTAFAFLQAAFAAEQIGVEPVKRTPESDTVVLVIAIPKDGALVASNPVWMQCRIDGFSLGAGSSFDRADEIVETDMGQTIHVVVDDRPYFPINNPALDPYIQEGWYYDTGYRFQIPFKLDKGKHLLRVFPARSFGESLKGEKTFFASIFSLGSEEGGKDYDLTKPYLTYNEPSNQLYLVENKPILLDFYLSNCELTADGYRVRLTVDGKVNRILTSWQPYYIYGLKKGNHTVRLELINGSGKPVQGPFSDIQRTFTVHSASE
ncbi:MAG: hypothetical protein KGJ02_06030 [Verrucomicrobiota bacterium]|nr:hypothetical protein [Verrucomicrobiota bacterium]